MIYSQVLLIKLANRHLRKYGTSLQEIEAEEKKEAEKKKGKKKIEPWHLRYPFQNKQEDEEWHEWATKEVAKAYPKWDEQKLEMEMNIISMLCAPSSTYLFKDAEPGKLF